MLWVEEVFLTLRLRLGIQASVLQHATLTTMFLLMELLIIYFSDQTDAKLDTNTENFIMRLQRSPKNLVAGT